MPKQLLTIVSPWYLLLAINHQLQQRYSLTLASSTDNQAIQLLVIKVSPAEKCCDSHARADKTGGCEPVARSYHWQNGSQQD